MASTEIKSLDIMSIAKVTALTYGLMMLIVGVLVTLFGGMLGGVQGLSGGLLNMVLIIIIALIFGFVGGAVSAFIYNIVADKIGGIKFNS